MSKFDYDVIVIGSGFGGSVSAMRLTEKGYKVAVLECGKRWSNKTLPKSTWAAPKYLWMPRLGFRGIQRMSLIQGKANIFIISGSGVGGGSLVYANTLYEPLDSFWSDPQWKEITDWESELTPYYNQAKRMLGSNKAKDNTPSDAAMKRVAEKMGVGETYHTANVGVYYGEKGVEVDDPYFGGAGPTRTGCIECGACMVGCRHNSKNTLNANYLYLAEKAGARVFPERQASAVTPLPGGGYRVESYRPGLASSNKRRGSLTAEQVVFSGGVLGTMKLLGAMKTSGKLPHLSDRLGELVRTNSESILTAEENVAGTVDYSQGVAITSSIHPDKITHIEPVRYPRGSTALGLGYTMLVDGSAEGEPEQKRLVKFLKESAKDPKALFRSLNIKRWSQRALILLVMQARDNSVNMRFKPKRDGQVRLTLEQGHGEPNPTWIPKANEAARAAAEVVSGEPRSSIFEVGFDAPATAHILGGAPIGADPSKGVVDGYQRVFGHPGLHVADASTISANLGVNPSLTICAQTERMISLWPNKGEADSRPELGAAYTRLEPILPNRPIVPEGAYGTLTWVGMPQIKEFKGA
ncbi:MAG: GMC family oxidoreductase [Actinomycetia bacterium]|nr:GMC family oxidoreductase [Actinomycetes bacterium]